MKSFGNTILITGGGSGIGLETARRFAEKGNRVIITGRNAAKLEQAVAQVPNLHAVVCDINDEAQVEKLAQTIEPEFGALNMLMNNAAEAQLNRLTDGGAYEIAKAEMMTNYLSGIRLTERFLPLLLRQSSSAIINVSSVVAFAPGLSVPTYSASKAALHSYTQSLRLSLRDTSVSVFEVMPPLVDTELSKVLPGDRMSPGAVADEILRGIENDVYEMRIGATENLYRLYLQSPEKALLMMNRILQE